MRSIFPRRIALLLLADGVATLALAAGSLLGSRVMVGIAAFVIGLLTATLGLVIMVNRPFRDVKGNSSPG